MFSKKFMLSHCQALQNMLFWEVSAFLSIVTAHANLRHLYGESQRSLSLASLLCFSQNSNAYNLPSMENMTLKLHIMTHFDTFELNLNLRLFKHKGAIFCLFLHNKVHNNRSTHSTQTFTILPMAKISITYLTLFCLTQLTSGWSLRRQVWT